MSGPYGYGTESDQGRASRPFPGVVGMSERTGVDDGAVVSRASGDGDLKTGVECLPPGEKVPTSVVRGVVEGDRRRHTRRPRVSWAADQPFTGSRPDRDRGTGWFQPGTRRMRWARRSLAQALAGDTLLAAAVTVVTLLSLGWAPHRLWVAAAAAVLWPLILLLTHGYGWRYIGSGPEEFQAVMRAGVALMAVIGLGAYITTTVLPRRWVFVAAPAVCLLTLVWRYLMRQWLHRQRRHGRGTLRTLVVGGHRHTKPVIRDLARAPHHGYQVVGACVPDLPESLAQSTVKVLGSLSDIPQVVVDQDIDVVIVTGSELSGPALRRLSWALERAGTELVVAPGLVEVAGPHVALRPTAGLSLVHLEIPSQKRGIGFGKALLDRIGGGILLLLALPVILVCGLAVNLTSRGPVFFRQARAGIDGKPFTMWKLRSMVVDAEARKQELLARNESGGVLFKMKRDPRITPVGAVLRRYSLDELPQLWNVVKGDMSLVGPRPPLLSETAQYHDAVHRRLRVKPGLTGLWQVSGRSDLSWDESVNLDLRYVDNWSLAMDLLILWKTARVVLRGSGAY